MKVIVVKDEAGILRPKAGLWLNEKYDREEAERFIARPVNKGLTFVECELTELV